MTKLHKKVLLVEDNHAEAKLTKIAFAGLFSDLDLVHCAEGEQLLHFLEKSSINEISYILLDLNMPRLSGIELLEKLKAHEEWKYLPTIIFTSSAFEVDIRTCLDLGANAYVVKPVEYDLLESRLTAIHMFWGQVNQVPQFPDSSAT